MGSLIYIFCLYEYYLYLPLGHWFRINVAFVITVLSTYGSSYGSGDDTANANSVPFLCEEVLSLKGLEVVNEQPEPVQAAPEPVVVNPPPVAQEQKPAGKKPAKPKWLKMWCCFRKSKLPVIC